MRRMVQILRYLLHRFPGCAIPGRAVLSFHAGTSRGNNSSISTAWFVLCIHLIHQYSSHTVRSEQTRACVWVISSPRVFWTSRLPTRGAVAATIQLMRDFTAAPISATQLRHQLKGRPRLWVRYLWHRWRTPVGRGIVGRFRILGWQISISHVSIMQAFPCPCLFANYCLFRQASTISSVLCVIYGKE